MKSGTQIEKLDQVPGGISFRQRIERPLRAEGIDILQLNVGKQCNLSCKHCHVEAGPHRTELMERAILEKALELIRINRIGTVDITGGAPEMNPHLPWFLEQTAPLDCRVLVRSNLVILHDRRYSRFLDIFPDNRVEIVSSLPDYNSSRVDRQRGPGAFESVINAMRLLNDRGYGREDSDLILDLAYNPVGSFLPGSQAALEQEYKRRLRDQYGVTFNTLFCLTNCPVGRYLEYLIRSENYGDYMTALIHAFNSEAVDRVMCRFTLSVGWDGTLYDCDFNQMLEIPVDHGAPDHITIFDFDRLKNRQIMIGNHCFSCTAGAGSSCQGETGIAKQ